MCTPSNLRSMKLISNIYANNGNHSKFTSLLFEVINHWNIGFLYYLRLFKKIETYSFALFLRDIIPTTPSRHGPTYGCQSTVPTRLKHESKADPRDPKNPAINQNGHAHACSWCWGDEQLTLRRPQYKKIAKWAADRRRNRHSPLARMLICLQKIERFTTWVQQPWEILDRRN